MILMMERMKQRRKELGYTFQDLANLTQMSKSTLQRYETGGIKNIPLSRLEDLSQALGRKKAGCRAGAKRGLFPVEKRAGAL